MRSVKGNSMRAEKLIVSGFQILWVLSLIPWSGLLLAIPFMFDSPGSEHDPKRWVAVYALLSYPITVPISLVGSSWLVRNQEPWWAIALVTPANVNGSNSSKLNPPMIRRRD